MVKKVQDSKVMTKMQCDNALEHFYDDNNLQSVMDGSNALKPDNQYDIERDFIVVNVKKHKIYFASKRIFDIILSCIAIIILSPLFLLTAIAIRLDSKGSIIFTQMRTGKDGKEFKMYKFRSMYQGAEQLRNDLINQNEMDGPVFKISRDPRVTRVGRFIRKTSIDELPQLMNIIKGEMSIVGPRPLAVYETKKVYH